MDETRKAQIRLFARILLFSVVLGYAFDRILLEMRFSVVTIYFNLVGERTSEIITGLVGILGAGVLLTWDSLRDFDLATGPGTLKSAAPSRKSNMTISLRQKNILDKVLWAVGAFIGYLVANVQAFPPAEQALVTGVGVLAGDAVSDIIAFVDTGTVSSALVSKTWADVKPYIQGEIQKLPATDQPFAAAALQVIDAKLGPVPTPAPATP
jgi:hypothetical protein